ncbi:helix-turn-helix domain-containing protein [Nocardia rhizosphaerihabitans]|nr:helix-turn-helix transcriptional regulator [Nocardia rhizosphaerihabitans]
MERGGWKRLAERVVARRVEVGMPTRQALADATGLSYRLLGDLERGDRPVSDGSLAVVEQALGWTAGVARKIVDGTATGIGAADFDGLLSVESDVAVRDPLSAIERSSSSGLLDRVGRPPLVPRRIARVDWNEELVPGVRPTVLRIALGEFLRTRRDQLGYSLEQVEAEIGCTTKDLAEVEQGAALIGRQGASVVLSLYGVYDRQIHQEFWELAESADRSGWWTTYTDVLPDWFQPYIGMEQRAKSIRTFECQYVPGILQTPSYARAVIQQMSRPSEVSRKVSVRMQRQRVLHEPGGPTLWAVIDEVALARSPQGIAMEEQVGHLARMSEERNITIQILPAHRYQAPRSFSVLRMPNGIPDIVYIEELTSALYLDRLDEVEEHRKQIDRIGIAALTPIESVEFLLELHERLRHGGAGPVISPTGYEWSSGADVVA